MVYSKHYKLIAGLKGNPILNYEQHNRLLNIISLEVRIDELDKIEEKVGLNNYLFHRKENLKKKLFFLTKLDAPHMLLQDLIDKSKD